MSSAERDPSRAVVGSEVASGGALVPMMESAEVRNRHDTLLDRGSRERGCGLLGSSA